VASWSTKASSNIAETRKDTEKVTMEDI